MENLKKIREKKKITQVRLSIAAEVSQETISAYESGKAFPSVETLIKIAYFLGTSTDYLLGRINDDMPLLSIKKNGFDVSVRLSPFIDSFVDYNVLANIQCNKILVEFLRVNTWVKRWFGYHIDLSEYTVKQSNYWHLPLSKKQELIRNIKGFKEVTVCEDESEAYEYWKHNFNPNPNDCCNLRKL